MALRRRLSAVAALSKSGSPWYCSRVLARYQRRERLGRIISRQSRSPRCRPRMSISAEARLVAQGDVVAVAQVNGLHHPLILPGVVAVGVGEEQHHVDLVVGDAQRPPAGGRPDGWRGTARRADPWPRPRDGRWWPWRKGCAWTKCSCRQCRTEPSISFFLSWAIKVMFIAFHPLYKRKYHFTGTRTSEPDEGLANAQEPARHVQAGQGRAPCPA